MTNTMSYAEAGVNIDEGNLSVERIKAHVERTRRPEVVGGLGGFGGCFAFDARRYQEPILVSGTDGVGTKLAVAIAANQVDTVGIDCVAMCVNDILVSGAEPLFFLDYLAVGHLDAQHVERVVKGVADGCVDARCALVGGETAEMPGFYKHGDFDVAGFAVGVVDKAHMLTGEDVVAGDVVLGIASTGLHSNGFSLARKVLLEKEGLSLDKDELGLGLPLKEALLKPTQIYVRGVLELVQDEKRPIKALAHITGGGLLENLPRSFPATLDAQLDPTSWPVPPIFEAIERLGPVARSEMYRTFNMGIGLCAVVSPEWVKTVMDRLTVEGYSVYVIGRMVPGSGRVTGLTEGTK